MVTNYRMVLLTQEQFDLVEEAKDLMAMRHTYLDSINEAIALLAEDYIIQHGPEFETNFDPNSADETAAATANFI